MANSVGIMGADAAIVDLQLQAHISRDEKEVVETTNVDVNESIKGEVGPADDFTYDEPVTSRKELWSWWLYYGANNSAGTLSYAPLIFQSILDQAGFNGNDPTKDCSDSSAPCVVKFGTSNVNIDTVVLICNGLIFAFQGVFLICFGSMGDYGRWKRWILLFWTLVCWAMQFGFLGLKHPSQYQAAIGIYIISTLSYNLCQAFWTPSLPLLARNTPEALENKRAVRAGEISVVEYEHKQMMQRNRLSNIGFGFMSVGYTFTLLIALGAAYGLNANSSDEANFRAATIIVGIATGVWIILGSPWFFLEKSRSAKLPEGETYFSVGVKAYWQVLKHIPKLSQTWLYLVGYFLISDGYATTNQIYSLCQYSIVSYNTTTSTELYIVQGAANVFGIALFWLIQKHFNIRTKVILIVNCAFLLVIPIWGCIGIGSTKFGFHNLWEVWAFSVIDCAAVAPFYAFSATMLSDLCPKGREVTFFALYSLVSKSTSWIGPIISGIIIDRTGNTWKGFPFSLGLSVAGYICICFVNVKKGQAQCEEWTRNDPTLRDRELHE